MSNKALWLVPLDNQHSFYDTIYTAAVFTASVFVPRN